MPRKTIAYIKELLNECVKACEEVNNNPESSFYCGVIDGLQTAAKIVGYELETYNDINSDCLTFIYVVLKHDGHEIFRAPVKSAERDERKRQFMESGKGVEIKECVKAWDFALYVMMNSKNGTDRLRRSVDMAVYYQQKFEEYQKLLFDLFDVKYEYVHDEDFYGVATQNRLDWLFKVEADRSLKDWKEDE